MTTIFSNRIQARLLPALFALLGAASFAHASPPGPGNLEADQQLIMSALSAQDGPAQQAGRSPLRAKLLAEAQKKRLDANPKYAAVFKQAREEALAKAAILDRLNTAPVSEPELKAAYDKLKESYQGKSEFKVRHFIMATEQEALDILTSLKAGADFAKLARAKSKDGASAALGGNAGWLTDCMLGCNYTEGLKKQAAEVGYGKLPKRPISGPMGWHVAIVDQIRPLPVPSLTEARPQLLRETRQQKFHKELGDLLK